MLSYELYGRLAERYERECQAHRETVDLLRRVVAGEVAPSRITVSGDAWTLRGVTPPADQAPEGDSA